MSDEHVVTPDPYNETMIGSHDWVAKEACGEEYQKSAFVRVRCDRSKFHTGSHCAHFSPRRGITEPVFWRNEEDPNSV